jgi:hypothetical protein
VKAICSGIVAGIALLGMASLAQGATLVTSMLHTQSGAQTTCTAVNAGKKPIVVQMRLLDNGGSQLTALAPSIAPGHGLSVSSGVEAGFGFFRYCTFEFQGGKNSIRASMEMNLGTGGSVQVDAR